MLLLCDCPDRLAGLVPPGSLSEVPPEALAPGDRAAWTALAAGARPWRGEARDPGAGSWSLAVVVGEAPGSQFDVLRERLAGGLELRGPTAGLALAGRGFHGQRDRPWMALAGNLHLCAVFPRPGLAARGLPSLPMLPVVAVCDALRELSGGALRPGIKWVNDVLVDGRKVGGVITSTQTQGDRVGSVLLGIGLNVAVAPTVPPTPFVPRVGSLADAGLRASWADAALAVLGALGRRLAALRDEGPGALLEAYRSASVVVGREVCVFPETADADASRPLVRGRVLGIGPDLALSLAGVATPVTAGRLAFAEDCPPPGSLTS